MNDNDITKHNSSVINKRVIEDVLSIKLLKVSVLDDRQFVYIVRTELIAWGSKPAIKEFSTLAKAVNHYDSIAKAFTDYSNNINAALHANLMNKYRLFSNVPKEVVQGEASSAGRGQERGERA